MSSKDILGDDIRKVDPTLRVYADCKIEVNTIRAEHSANLKVPRSSSNRSIPYVMSMTSPEVGASQALLETTSPVRSRKSSFYVRRSAAYAETTQTPDSIASMEEVEGAEVAVFIHTSSSSTDAQTRETLATGQLPENVRVHDAVPRGNLVVGSVGIAELKGLIEHDEVMYVEAGQALAPPRAKIATERVGEPPLSGAGEQSAVHMRQDEHGWGQDVLIGIIDVEGFDFAHEDFLMDNGTTRFVSIWDQGGEVFGGERDKNLDFSYGNMLTSDIMNQAIKDAGSVKVPVHMLAPQSQMVIGSHGTHVASIAAGNHSFCRQAKIVGVLLTLPRSDTRTFDETGIVRSDIELERRFSFYDSSRIAHAVEYILKVAEKEGEPGRPMPVAINISLGTNGHAHDGSVAINRWLDNALAVPGRAVCVAAGNAGQEDAAFEGDTGYVMGRIHTSGRIAATELVRDLEWIIVGNGVSDISENEMEIWYGPHDRFAVQVKPPGLPWTKWIEPREFMENEHLVEGEEPDKRFVSFLSIYNELFHPANGSNRISIYLTPFLSPDPSLVTGIKPGRWIVRLKGLTVRDGKYDAWIERDDPRPIGRNGTQEFWRFPSFFSAKSNVDDTSVGSLACGQRVISVANLDEAAEAIAISSSQGPTRDGRSKPDIAAPGTDIVAARGFVSSGDAWVKMSGTSMAAPYATSVAGLMLAINPKLTASQIEGIMKGTTKPLPGADYKWSNQAGFGRIDADACVEQAIQATERNDLSTRTLRAQQKGGSK